MSAWGWQESGPASDFVSSARPGGNPAEILRRQDMRLNPSAGNPFQISPQDRAGILAQQMQAGTSAQGGFKNGGMVQMQPNNGRPVGHEFANGVQMNPIMGGVRSESQAQMQPFQQLPPSMPQQMPQQGGNTNSAWNTAFSQANGLPVNNKWDAAGQQAYLKQISAANPMQSRMSMPVGAQQMAQMGGQNQQQQLMMLLQQLFGRS